MKVVAVVGLVGEREGTIDSHDGGGEQKSGTGSPFPRRDWLEDERSLSPGVKLARVSCFRGCEGRNSLLSCGVSRNHGGGVIPPHCVKASGVSASESDSSSCWLHLCVLYWFCLLLECCTCATSGVPISGIEKAFRGLTSRPWNWEVDGRLSLPSF